MPALEPPRPPSIIRSRPELVGLTRPTARALQALDHQTVMRLAAVQSAGLVQAEKLHEIDRLAETAMVGQTMLARWRETLAGADPMLQDELRFFTDVARLGKGEVIVDTISSLRNR